MPEILRVEKLHKVFGSLEVLRGVDLSVHRGETIVILGSSGSGKSTLLRCINLLEIPTSGRIYLDGAPVGRQPNVPVLAEAYCLSQGEHKVLFRSDVIAIILQ